MKYDYLDYEQIKKMGERIKISRKSNNMTQSELADIWEYQQIRFQILN